MSDLEHPSHQGVDLGGIVGGYAADPDGVVVPFPLFPTDVRVAHVAGLMFLRRVLGDGGRLRQLCTWCGVALLDTTPDPTDDPDAFETLTIVPGAWVVIDALGFPEPVGHTSAHLLPPDGCVMCEVAE